MPKNLLRVVLAFAVLLTFRAWAVKDIELVARANFHDGFQLPAKSYITNATPILGERGAIAFKVVSVAAQKIQGIWYRPAHSRQGKIVYRAPKEKTLSHPDVAAGGHVAFAQFDLAGPDGVFEYHPDHGTQLLVDPADYKNSLSFDFPQWGANGSVWFRFWNSNNERFYRGQTPGGKLKTLLREGKKLSFLFRPNVAGKYHVLKVRHGDSQEDQQPDSIFLYGPNTDRQIVAKDQAAGSSRYKSFDNSPSVSRRGHVAFVAQLEKNRAVFLWHNGKTREIAREGKEVATIEYFSPQVNAHGTVAFRAKNQQGQRGVYVFREGRLHRVVGEGSLVPSDRGQARIYKGSSMPAFGGNVGLNNRGELTFHCVLAAPNKQEQTWGTAIYKVQL